MKTRADSSGAGLRGRWITFARLGWVLIALISVNLFVAAIPPRFTGLSAPCGGEDCLRVEASLEGAAALERELGLSLKTYAVIITAMEVITALVFISAGVIIFWRRSDDWMAIFVSLTLIFFGIGATAFLEALANAQPVMRLPINVWQVLGSSAVVVVFYLFPNGRFVPSWTRWLAIAIVVSLLVLASASLFIGPIWFVALVVGSGTGLYAQIHRYRYISGPVERQQTKWVVFGFGMAFVGTFFLALPQILFPSIVTPINTPMSSVADFIYLGPYNFIFAFMPIFIMPVTIAIATLRFRLWDVDPILNLALIYGTLTGLLALIYFGSVILLQQAFRALTGEDSPVAIVISTLVIAALFNPMRKRIQDIIDRRFYRSKYDAQQALAAFSATARDEVELEQLTGQLLSVVQEVMQPEKISLWLRPSEPSSYIGKRVERGN